MSDLTDKDHAELILLYQVTIDDIEKAKKWEWNVAYATIAAQGAILGLAATFNTHRNVFYVRVALSAAVLILTFLGVNYVSHAQSSLRGFRARLRKVRQHFGVTFKSSFGEPNPKRLWALHYPILLTTFIVIGLLWL